MGSGEDQAGGLDPHQVAGRMTDTEIRRTLAYGVLRETMTDAEAIAHLRDLYRYQLG